MQMIGIVDIVRIVQTFLLYSNKTINIYGNWKYHVVLYFIMCTFMQIPSKTVNHKGKEENYLIAGGS